MCYIDDFEVGKIKNRIGWFLRISVEDVVIDVL